MSSGGQGTVDTDHVADSAVTSQKIAPGAVTKTTLAPNVSPQGKTGPTGATGPQGPIGKTGKTGVQLDMSSPGSSHRDGARYANYGQELCLYTTPQKFGCSHGRHARLQFPDGQ